MAIFISHAAADSELAGGLENFLERRGHFVELDDGETALRPLQASDVVVLLISQNLVMSLYRLRLERRALDAWAEGRLILIRLDSAFAPIGLRDLPAIDASFEARREFIWGEVAKEIQEKLSAPHNNDAAPGGVRPPKPGRPKGSGFGWLALIVLMAPGLAFLAAAVSINRIGPAPGGLDELRAGLDALGARYGLPAGTFGWAGLAAIAVMVVALVMLMRRTLSKPRPPAMSARISNRPSAAKPEMPSDAVFVSYARANSALVLPMIDAAKRGGKKFWLDQQGGVSAGDNWAGEIVRAIKDAPNVLVMCSAAAFESDHVKREIYLADRYKKRLLPVFIEAAEAPEDFEYFFAGIQGLNLFETPEAERPAALLRVLEAA